MRVGRYGDCMSKNCLVSVIGVVVPRCGLVGSKLGVLVNNFL